VTRPARGASARGASTPHPALGDDPQWYRDAIVYEVHVRTYRDSDGDGIGDFRGLTQKLDHIADLGVTAVWVLPFYPSPGRDGGYDIADYRGVNPDYGTLRDFRRFVAEAHRRGLRVITELVPNHTSDQHPWFGLARRARPGTVARNRYVWSDTPDRYAEARVIFTDTEPSNWTWDPEAGAYFWHRFFHHQPDLNFDEPSVHREMFRIVDFWLGMGVDGLRLDAVPYLYEREGTNCENLPETHAFLRALRAHVDERFPGRMLLAEANQWPERAVAYFGDGDECHMAFHFPLMPRLYIALRREDRYPIVDILEQTPDIPEIAQWALFLRNHDELTLEMVTDEERDLMYRVYADDPQMRLNLGIRRRLAPLVGRDRRRMELLHGLLFSLPGTPFLYYGDEIGMGDNVYLGDRDGVRTPMQWSADLNGGFSEADPARLCLPLVTDPLYHHATVNVASQRADPYSWLSWLRRLIDLRKRTPVFGRGRLDMLAPSNPRVLAFVREHAGEAVLVVANLSRYVQPARLELPRHAGWRPVELIGQTRFPVIGDDGSMTLTLAPHSFLWFGLEEPAEAIATAARPAERPTLPLGERWPARRDDGLVRALANVVAHELPERPWFRHALRRRDPVSVLDLVPLDEHGRLALLLVSAGLQEGDEVTVLLPLAITDPDDPGHDPELVLGTSADGRRVVVDAATDPALGAALLGGLARGRRRITGWHGRVEAEDGPALREVVRLAGDGSCRPARVGSRNVSLRMGDAFLKLYRRVEAGEHVELEVGRHLRAARPEGVLGLGLGLTWRMGGAPLVIGGAGEGVAAQGDGWAMAVDAVARSLERLSAEPAPAAIPEHGVAADWLEMAARFGERTATLHRTLANVPDPAFRPEPFGELSQRALYQAIRTRIHEAVSTAEARARGDEREAVDERHASDARRLAALRPAADAMVRRLLERPIAGRRVRCHGDLRLGHFLYVGGELMVVDFEGDPARPMSERRLRHSPYRDVAAVVTSFAEAAGAGLELSRQRAFVRDDGAAVERWLLAWLSEVADAVVSGHAGGMAGHDPALLPGPAEDAALLFACHLVGMLCVRIADGSPRHPERHELLVPLLEAVVERGA
jgi:maltose alpha-D-glucosyltransferase / alpha-amylase